jgi:PTS system nitrogen regulatory IIA component
VIRAAVKLIARDIRLDAEVITELLLDREKLMPTALSNGIAVPHTRDFLLQESFDVVAVAFPKKPIEYGALDGQPVHTLFFLFACDDKRHLHLLAKLAHLNSNEENLAFLRTHPAKASLLEYVKNWEGNLKSGAREAASVT